MKHRYHVKPRSREAFHGWSKQTEQGRKAYFDGKSHDQNPYNYFRNTPANIGMAGAWSSGWLNGQTEDLRI